MFNKFSLKKSKNSNKLKGDFSFQLYMKKIVKQVHPTLSIDTDALDNLNAFINLFIKKIVFESIKLQNSDASVSPRGSLSTRKTMDARTIQHAVKSIIPGELSKHAVSEGLKAIRAGRKANILVIPVARVKNAMKKYYNGRMAETAAIYLAAVCEYMLAEFLELSGNAAKDLKRKRINVRCLFLVANGDEELKMLCKKMKWVWSGAHTEQYLHYVIVKKYQAKNEKAKRAKLAKKRSFRKSRAQRSFGAKSFKKHRKIFRDSIQGITKASLTKLTRKAGIYRINGLIYEELRGIIKVYLENLIRDVINITLYKRKKIVSKEDVYEASEFKVYPTIKPAKVLATHYFGAIAKAKAHHRNKIGFNVLSDIRYYQKNPGLIIPKLSFQRLVREIGQDFARDLKYSKRAMDAIQQLTEHYIVDLLTKTNIIILHHNQVTINPRDLQAVRRIMN